MNLACPHCKKVISYSGEPPSRMSVTLVRFTPGARSNWHSHAVGQTLHVTGGMFGGMGA